MDPEQRPGRPGTEQPRSTAMPVSKQQSNRKSQGPKLKKAKTSSSTRSKRNPGVPSPVESPGSAVERRPRISIVASGSETPIKGLTSLCLSTADSKLPPETAINKLASPEQPELPADAKAVNDANERCSEAVPPPEPPPRKAHLPAAKWSAAAASRRVLSTALSTATLVKGTLAANRVTTIGVSIITILAITAVGIIYLLPLYRRERRFATTDSWATTASGAVTGTMACVDPSTQLALELGGGKVYGNKSAKIYSSGIYVRRFFGISYGASTAAKGRFGPAVAAPPLSANSTLYAYSHGPPCAQLAPNESQPEGSEDCLKLSIWAPFVCQPTDPLKKVVVALASDWFQTGRVTDHEELWRTMAADGDVVVVALNVRLGVLGYLSSTSEQAPGNAAFTDVSVALSWIRTNIAVFHGNPEEIVALGLGAGSLILSTILLTTADSDTYFQRLILHGLSPTSLLPRNGVENAIALGKRLACSDANNSIGNIISCLRTRDWKDIVVKSRSFAPLQFVPSRDINPLSFGPTLNAIGRSLDGVSILCGYSRKEAQEVVDTMMNVSTALESSVADESFARIAHFFTRTNESDAFKNLSANAKAVLEDLNEFGIRQLFVDAIYHCALEELAVVATQKKAVVFFYVITDSGSPTPLHYLTQIIRFIKTAALDWLPFGANEEMLLINSTATNYPVSKWRTELCPVVREISNALSAQGGHY